MTFAGGQSKEPDQLSAKCNRGVDRAWRYVEALVAAAFGVSAPQLRADRRSGAEAVFARQAAMYLAHVGLGLSYTAVAQHFGRDRTTVAHACARIEDCREEPEHARIFDCLETAVGHWRWDLRRGGGVL